MDSLLQYKWVIFSLIAVLCYGFCGPLQKKTYNFGGSIYAAQIMYGIGIAVIGIIGIKGQSFTNSKGIVYAILFGIAGGIGMKSVSLAFFSAGANVANIAITVGLFPLVTVILSFFWLKEQIAWGRFSLAVLFGIMSIYLAVTSQTKAP
jgi:drug/metabolite transporter (DMT)-like permease